MKIKIKNLIGLIKEEIHPYTNTATVYHAFGKGSTGSNLVPKDKLLEIIETIMRDGFTPGEGDYYGKGVYTVYDLADLRSTYGSYALIFTVSNMNKFLIFNYREAKKIYGKQHRIIDQLKSNGILINEELNFLSKKVDEKNRSAWAFTSDLAQKFRKIPEVRNKIHGIVFSGRQDGKVLVGYDVEDFTLTGYAETFPSKTSSYNRFILDSKKFLESLESFYKLKDQRIDKKAFLRELRDLFLRKTRSTSEGKDLLSNMEKYDFRQNVLKEEEYYKILKAALDPEIYDLYQELQSIIWSEDESHQKRVDEIEKILENTELYELETEALNETYQIFQKELNHFFRKGYFDGMLRKFNLDDSKFIVNVKDLPKKIGMA